MSERKAPSKREHPWRIVRLKSTPAAQLGIVMAPDEKSAIKRAATRFQVPLCLRDRLAAFRTK
jgi:hypothetical protein